MSHLRGSVSAIIMLLSLALTGLPFGSLTAPQAAARGDTLRLAPVVLASRVVGGGPAGLFIHTAALAQLALTVAYPDGEVATYHGRTDVHGRFVFSWRVPLTLRQAGNARLELRARRGALSANWRGVLAVYPAPPPPLFVQPTASHFVAGTSVGLFISTAPRAQFTYHIATDQGRLLAQGMDHADMLGRFVLTVPERYLPKRNVDVIAAVTVHGPSGIRRRTARFLLLPRPPLPLSLKLLHAQVHIGEPMTVSVTSAPAAKVSLRMVVGGKTILQTTGATDATGHWTYTTDPALALTRARAAHLLVVATRGIDRTSSQLTFLLQPARFGIPDRLASRVDPTPNLARFFTRIPAKVILVSTEGQAMRAYEHGVLVQETYVTTGRPELPTPHGVFHIMAKYAPYEFISPWAAGSPFYYPPSWVHYAMLFDTGGYFIHDSPWRKVYGPGTNLPHYALDPGEPLGSHGCVNTPYNAMIQLWSWTTVGTTVIVY